MQFLNNLTDRQRQILIIGITAFIVLPFFYFVYQASSNNNPNKKGTYYDKNSGQTVVNDGSQPERYGVASNTPTYLGTTALFDIGVTKYQRVALEQALLSFAKTISDNPSELSIDTKSITAASYDPEADNPISETTFTLQVDRKTKYKVRMQYSGISNVKIIVSDMKDQQLFVSSEVDGSKINE